MSDLGAFICLIVGAFLLVGGLAVGGAYLFDRPSCEATAEVMGVPHHWSLWTNCMIEPAPGKWIQLDKYHEIATDN